MTKMIISNLSSLFRLEILQTIKDRNHDYLTHLPK